LPLLQTADIHVRFGGIKALGGVDLEAEAGYVTGLIGPNGAGKTTLFNVISGLQAPTKGRVWLDGRDITSLPVHRRARLGLARTFQRLEVFGSLTVWDNVRVAVELQRRYSRTRGVDVDETAQSLLERAGIAHLADQRADTLSTGAARLTELARALATSPRLLLLDEPGSGLDSAESESFGRLLVELAGDGLGILMVEHDMELVMEVCSRIHVLDFGIKIAEGSPAEVRADPQVQAAYLGADEAAAPEEDLEGTFVGGAQ
jgi:branched-chain amino acid transport system ATP-binding protein